ncbi:hypothetical protein [Clostridium thermarum]|uniref:hypothetical protein n=1 Tax=Clostridium thermarum TaxID=1716543 RepID=UPI00111D9114|nr:hypothetical protein [Clostridium thermarum]
MKKRIIDGIIVSLFFIIPYSLILLTTYSAFFRDELRDAFKLLVWTAFSHPLRVIPQEIAHINSITFSAFEPLGIMVLLVLFNMITAKIQHNNHTK